MMTQPLTEGNGATIGAHEIAHEGLVRAGRNCIAGDMPSCNVLVYQRQLLIPLSESYDDPDTSVVRELCKAGLAAGCYMAYSPRLLGENGDEALVVRGCELGDSMSCAEVTRLAKTSERLMEYRRREDAAAKVECERGITIGCRHLVFQGIDEQQAVAILARACRDGSVDDCTGHGIHRVKGELAIEVKRMACTTLGEACDELAELVRNDKAALREALEHGCHHRQAPACARLLKAYRDRSLPEPIPGRAGSIATYLCGEDNHDRGEEVRSVCGGR